jgi:hypothetical protein
MLSDCLAAELEERRGLLAGLLLLFVAGRERVGIRRSALCALAVAAGVGTAQFRVASLSGPQIESPFATEVEAESSDARSASNGDRGSSSTRSGSA